MKLTTNDIAKMFDLSCVQVHYTESDIENLIEVAKEYKCGQVSVLQSFIAETKKRLVGLDEINLVGNVSFPSGSDSSEMKVIQAKQMVDAKCDEIDMVLNVNWVKSGSYDKVKNDIEAVVKTVGDIPLKVIIEVACLTDEEIATVSKICVEAGATFVKTGTGWTGPTTVDHIKVIKAAIGDSAKIKASGGVKNLDLLLEMYKEGARRFGVNLEGGVRILEECNARGGSVSVD